MKRILIAAVTLLVGTMASGAVLAQEDDNAVNFYAGGTLSLLQFDYSGQTYLLSGVGGVRLTRYLAAEIRVGTGVTSDDDQGLTVSLLGKVIIPVNETFAVYGLAGFTRAKTEFASSPHSCLFATSSCSFTDENSGVTYGVGISVQTARHMSVSLEYVHLYSVSNAMYPQDVNAASLAILYHF